jgi:hypothetical protein
MLSKKSKIEQLPKSRERQCLPATASASLCQMHTKLCGRLLVIRGGPSHRRARHAPAALKNLVHLSEKPFSTASVKGCLCGQVGGTAGVAQIADDLLHRLHNMEAMRRR